MSNATLEKEQAMNQVMTSTTSSVQERGPHALDLGAISRPREALTGHVTLPSDPDYDRVRAVWNGMIDRCPALIRIVRERW